MRRALIYIYGSDDKLRKVTRSIVSRTFEGMASGLTAGVALTATGTVDVQGGVLIFGLISVVPPIFRALADVGKDTEQST